MNQQTETYGPSAYANTAPHSLQQFEPSGGPAGWNCGPPVDGPPSAPCGAASPAPFPPPLSVLSEDRLRLDTIEIDPMFLHRRTGDHKRSIFLGSRLIRGELLPPLLVTACGEKHKLLDGLHTLRALKALGTTTAACLVARGTPAAAVAFACGRNMPLCGGLRSDGNSKHATYLLAHYLGRPLTEDELKLVGIAWFPHSFMSSIDIKNLAGSPEFTGMVTRDLIEKKAKSGMSASGEKRRVSKCRRKPSAT